MSMAESVRGPVKLWNQALKAVKGEHNDLGEEFTAEMTLVAEGLVEDQARLRQAVDELERSRDRETQALSSELEALNIDVREQQRENDKYLSELDKRLDVMEKQQLRGQKEIDKRLGELKEIDKRLSELSKRLDAMEKLQLRTSSNKGMFGLPTGWMDKLLILAGVVCGSWVLTSILNLFH